MKQNTYNKRASLIRGLSMAVFMGACLGLQADDKGVSAGARVGDKGVSVNADVDRSDRNRVDYQSDRNARNDGKLSRGDANFIREAAKGGHMEVMMGQTAKDRASNADVKRYGERLVKDHTDANAKLAQLASQKGLELAKATDKDTLHDHGKMVMDLEKKTGADFDKEFVKHALKDHKKDISKFEKASRDSEDSDVRSFASATLPKLREHQMEAERLARSLGVDVNVSDASDANFNARAEASGAPARVDIDVDRDRDAKIQTDVKVDNDRKLDTDKGDGKTLGIDFDRNQSKDNKVEVDIDRDNDAKIESKVNVDTDKGDGKTLGVDVDGNQTRNNKVDVDIDRDRDAKVETRVDVDTDKGDGKTLGVETRAADGKTLGVETEKGDGKVLGVQTRPGDGKTLGLNTSKDDGKLLGILPAPGRTKAENRVDVDIDRDDHRLEVDSSVGAPATTEKGVSARVDVNAGSDAKVMVYNDVPAKVQGTIQKEGGDERGVKVKKHTMNGKTAYRVEIEKDGRNRVLQVAEDGTIIKDNNAK